MKKIFKLSGVFIVCLVFVFITYQFLKNTGKNEKVTDNTATTPGSNYQVTPILEAVKNSRDEMEFNFSEDEVVATLASITPVGSDLDEIKVDFSDNGRIVADLAVSVKAYKQAIKWMEGQKEESNLIPLLKAIGGMMDSVPVYVDATAVFDPKDGVKLSINKFTFCFIEINKKYYPQLAETLTEEINDYFQKESKVKLCSFNISKKGLYVKLSGIKNSNS